MQFALPFPPVSKLSHNARLHWAQRAKLVKAARREGWALAAEAFAHAPIPDTRPLPVRFEIHAPDKRCRDLDNIISALKPYCDGIADAIGVDDAHWSHTYTHAEPIKGGCVIVTIGGEP